MSYQERLSTVKENYPFERWRQSYDDGLTQYTQENCDKAKAIFDELINGLVTAGEDSDEATKVALFKKAIEQTNVLNKEIDDLIETGEREDLCDLTDEITFASGLDPEKYGDGEGLASEWREW